MSWKGWVVGYWQIEEKWPYHGSINRGWVITISIHLHLLNLAAGCGTSLKLLHGSQLPRLMTIFFSPCGTMLLWHYTLVSSPFFPVLLAFSWYFIFSIPFALLDVLGESTPLFECKLQKQRRPTICLMLRTLGMAVYNHLVFVFPWMPAPPLPVVAPTVWKLISGVLGVLLMFDTATTYFIRLATCFL